MRKKIFLLLMSLLLTLSFQSIIPSPISAQDCTYSITPKSEFFCGCGGGNDSITVTAPMGCNWPAVSNDEWITIDSGSTGTGDGVVAYSYEKINDEDLDFRMGTITVAGQTFTLLNGRQKGLGHITGRVYDAVSGTNLAGAEVTSPFLSPKPFITNNLDGVANYGLTGSPGTFDVTCTVDGYVNTSLTGISIEVGKAIIKDIPMSPCTYGILPTSQFFSSSGDTGSISVSAPDECTWMALNNDPDWITITSGSDGNGNGTVEYSVVSNISASSRTGTMTIAGKTFKVDQAGVGASPTPDVKANGSDVPVMLETSNPLLVSISLAAGGSLGIDGDWWAVAYTPFGWYHYDKDSDSWVPGLIVTFQGSLFNLTPPFTVLNMTGLPVGFYTFYFGVDMVVNGLLDMTQIFYDSVEVNIIP